jgi:hypothetical protein
MCQPIDEGSFMNAPTQLLPPIKLPPAVQPVKRELQTFFRELPRLLEEGQEGRFALIKGDEIVSIWDTNRDAAQAGHERFGLEPFITPQIRARELVLIDRIQWEE